MISHLLKTSKIVQILKMRDLILGVVLTALTTGLFAIEPEERLVTNAMAGKINSNTMFHQLLSLFGPTSVKTGDIPMAEGTTFPGAMVLEGSEDALDVIFVNDFRTGEFVAKNGKFEDGAKAVVFHGRNWRTAEGIGIGSTLAEVEKANGKPFELGQFETDMHGQVWSWNEGTFQPNVHIGFRTNNELPADEYQRYVFQRGDKPFLSSDPEFVKMQPVVASFWVEWGSEIYQTPVQNVLAAMQGQVNPDPEALGRAITNLESPWSGLFTLTDFDEKEVPLTPENWKLEPIFKKDDYACVHVMDFAFVPVINRVYSSAILLLQKEEGGDGVVISDLIYRRGGGYDDVISVKSIEGVAERPLVYMNEALDQTRRTGINRHQVFRIVKGDDGRLQFAPALVFESTYSEAERTETCDLDVDEGGKFLRASVLHEWMQDPNVKTVKTSVNLPMNDDGTFDISPLDGLITGRTP